MRADQKQITGVNRQCDGLSPLSYVQCKAFHLNGVQTELKCKPNVKRCKRFVFVGHSPLLHHNTLKTKAITLFQADHILTRFVFPPLAGYATIPEIAKERIRRSGAKIKADSSLTTQNLDTGFRVYRLDESNYEKVSLSPKEYKQDQLDLFAYNIKRDRTDLDLLYGSMLAWGVRLDLPLQTETMDGCTIYTVNEGELVACFSEGITDKVVTAMADKSPLRVLFRDACFKEDAQKINIYEQFKQSLDWSDNDAFNNIRVI